MTVDELRKAFIDFFVERDHMHIPSASLVPHGDPTLMFTSAGMVQFKSYFTGIEEPPAPRLTSIQRCFRTTDVEEVGDGSHLTLFEMLGNFSIGDYFKPEAIDWAWEFLVDVLGLPPDRLWATVYTDDDDAFELWKAKGLPEERVLRYTAEQGNWWGLGTGPCGPCSELHFDFGLTEGCEPCSTGACHPDVDCGRFLEIWNLVFTVYDQAEDGTRSDLPAPNIDTGAGLERIAAAMIGERSVYETDELRTILASVEEVSDRSYDPDGDPEVTRALRSITEHARAAAFLIADGVLPSNEGRGYVLRRVIRRAVYFGYRIGRREPFLDGVVAAAIDASAAANAELATQRDFIRRVVNVEEARFQSTLARGLELLEQVIEREADSRTIPGRDMFTLYDTHGLPAELTREVATARGFTVDDEGFDREMAAQRERSRGERSFEEAQDGRAQRYAALDLRSEFDGYDAINATSEVISLIEGGDRVERLEQGAAGEIVLAKTTLYPEGGGQVGDRGEIVTPGGRFAVEDTQRYGETVVHIGTVSEGAIVAGEAAESRVDPVWRAGSRRNHTGTHLLHAALRQVLGSHVRQAGSYVGPDRLRFDYTNPEAPTADQGREIQRIVREKIREDIAQETIVMGYEEAIERGAIAFFEDKYTAEVRMVEYCETRGRGAEQGHDHTPECYSRELCGGTHLHSTGQVGAFQIVSDSSIGAGLRRIEAVTGPEAERYIDERLDQLDELAQHFKVPPNEIGDRVRALEEQLAAERKRLEQVAAQASAGAADDIIDAAEEIEGIHVLVARVEVDSADALRPMADRLRARLGSAFVALAAAVDGRPVFLAAATDDAVERGLRADEIVRLAAGITGGGGGGRPQMAQAGGRDLGKLDEALDAARAAARERLTS